MSQSDRPARHHIIDETGATRTLAAGSEAFTTFGNGDRPVFLGLGPDPAVACALVSGRASDFIECPDFAAAMPPDFAAAIPPDWRHLDPAELSPERAARSTFYLYRQNPRLFPSFWGPIWAKAQLALLPRPERAPVSPTIFLARSPNGLLEPELARALAALGKHVVDIPAETSTAALGSALCAGRPELYLCVNGAGLDDDGLVFSLLTAAGVPMALWFVDNPFHVLGRFRGPFWKKALLCVTDDAFCAPLQALGAGHVRHLPLAASDHFFKARPLSGLTDRAVFVGSSAFAGRDAFFAGSRVPEALSKEARDMVDRGERPDYFWWTKKLAPGPLWPGKTGRSAGCGAEAASLSLRTSMLTALAQTVPLTVYGDAGWKALLPETVDLRGPVDYYGALPGIYAGAGLVAGATSLLLPRGLTQRHFDVWAAGGCLLSDATPGLELFPAALTKPITYARPRDAAVLAKNLLATPSQRTELAAAWREAITAGHRYEHRLATLFDLAQAG
jgi:hypothetical protein